MVLPLTKPNVWGVIPYKGLIYFADLNNGPWAVPTSR
ncbi:MAG: hypothetical protein Ct9H300mP18_04690 [Candidatus Neomarinimicrobiota bacterium]|nr:MAG: hypothetical protein Ct9H300mP18_04690 [Candidatus Neomarinimicrobiota bacterium]